MKLVLRIVGIVLAIVGCIILIAGRSAATDLLGIIVLLVMGGLPLALGVFCLLKSGSKKGSGSNVPEQPSIPPMPEPEPVKIPEPEPVKAIEPDPVNEEPPAPAPGPEKPKYKSYSFRVAGISKRQRTITANLLTESSDYEATKKELVEIGMTDEHIYKYIPDVLDAELVPEPENPHDPNAVKVIVDNIHVGYVPAEKAEKVKKLLDTKQICDVSCEFYGGPYKIITEDYDLEKNKEVYTVERESQYIGAEVTIEYE